MSQTHQVFLIIFKQLFNKKNLGWEQRVLKIVYGGFHNGRDPSRFPLRLSLLSVRSYPPIPFILSLSIVSFPSFLVGSGGASYRQGRA